MKLNNFATMDVNMLLSLVNMQLRDRYEISMISAGRRISTRRPWSPGWPAAISTIRKIRSSSDRDPDHNPTHAAGSVGKSC
jgi:hypothetical protein